MSVFKFLNDLKALLPKAKEILVVVFTLAILFNITLVLTWSVKGLFKIILKILIMLQRVTKKSSST